MAFSGAGFSAMLTVLAGRGVEVDTTSIGALLFMELVKAVCDGLSVILARPNTGIAVVGMASSGTSGIMLLLTEFTELVCDDGV
jgi:hypothetical protein